MKIKREKIFVMWDSFERLLMKKNAVKFHYLILKNKQIIQPEVDNIREIGKTSERYQLFDNKRIKLCNDFAEKDENGQPVIRDNSFVIIPDKKQEFDSSLDALKLEFKDAIDELENKKKEIDELMEEDIEIPFVKIPLSVIPEDLLGKEVEVLFDIISDED